MSISRRGLFRTLLAGSAGALIAKDVLAQTFDQVLPSRSVAPTNQKWVMVIDLAKCDGCGKCTQACNSMHFVPDAAMDQGL